MDVLFSVRPIMVLLVQLLFQSVACPSLPFSCSPQSCPFQSFVLFLVGLCSWGKALFSPGRAVPLGKGWTQRSWWLQQVAGCLGRGPWLLHLPGWQLERLMPRCLCLPPSLWWGEWRPQQGLPSRPSQDAVASLSTPGPAGGFLVVNKGGFLVVTQWC